MACNCENKKYSISMGCCQPVLGPIENYYTKYQIDKMFDEVESAITSGCCITPEEVDEKIESAKTEIESEIPSLSGYATEQWVENKNYLTEHQPLKTINGYVISGTGNIEITASGGSISVDSELSLESTNPVENKVITEALNDKLDASAYTPTIIDQTLNSGSTNPVANSAITLAIDNKLDASAYTPIDLSIYATKSWVINKNYVTNTELIQYITNLQNQIDSLTELISGCCGSQSGETEYRWITMTGDNDYTCSGTTKYTKEKEQSSSDGINWTDTGNYRSGDTVLEENSVDCGYSPTPVANCDQYFTITANGNGAIRLSTDKLPQEYQYSKDGGITWYTIRNESNTSPIFVQMTSGESIMFKGELESKEYSTNGVAHVSTTIPSYEAKGNIMSLLYGDNFSGQTSLSGRSYVFHRLFKNCSGLTSAENLCLPATTLSDHCYMAMFFDCTSLTTPPSVLPATNLSDARFCYEEMFAGCSSLTTVPSLPATTLADACYGTMFIDCTSLTTIPSNLLPATTLVKWCYSNMFYGCTSLTTAPQLLATTLVQQCYQEMFYGCTSLNSITCLATDISAEKCTYQWVDGVASSGTFTKAASMNDWTTSIDGIPSNWTVVNE